MNSNDKSGCFYGLRAHLADIEVDSCEVTSALATALFKTQLVVAICAMSLRGAPRSTTTACHEIALLTDLLAWGVRLTLKARGEVSESAGDALPRRA